MGYCMNNREAKFTIKGENKADALAAIKNLDGHETIEDSSGRHFSWVSTERFLKAETLEEALDEWRWEAVVEEVEEEANLEDDASFEWKLPKEKDIVDIYFSGEKMGDDAVLFEAIAPFVEKDSFIEMGGEDGHIWRWCFDGQYCTQKDGTVTFD